MHPTRVFILFAATLAVSCSGEPEQEIQPEVTKAPVPGVYNGTFPCDGCPGIPTSLWLQSDRRFFMRQSYPANDEREALDAFSLGRWAWDADEQRLVLRGAGPSRVFTRPDIDSLLMETGSPLEHRLKRDPAGPDFVSRLAMAGTIRVHDGSASFTECLTGIRVPIERSGDYRRFILQYRSKNPKGAPAYVELEGRFNWTADKTPKSLVIERFISIRPDQSC